MTNLTSKDISIIAQCVYKKLMDKCLIDEIDAEKLYEHTITVARASIKADKTLNPDGYVQSSETLKTEPVRTNACKDCGAEMIIGKNGKPYCKPCYIKWAEANKPK